MQFKVTIPLGGKMVTFHTPEYFSDPVTTFTILTSRLHPSIPAFIVYPAI
jgi:hypothetical protein